MPLITILSFSSFEKSFPGGIYMVKPNPFSPCCNGKKKPPSYLAVIEGFLMVGKNIITHSIVAVTSFSSFVSKMKG
jgi:hypothetical protein